MFNIFHIIYFLFILNVESWRNNTVAGDIQYRVIGGRDVSNEEYPFVIILTRNTKKNILLRYCTASMITDEWGITAAHCLMSAPKFAWYGNFTEPPEKTKLFTPVVEFINHPSWYIEVQADNDIGLFRVSEKIHLPRYGRLLSVDRASMLGLPVKYVGAGATVHLYKSLNEILSDLYKQLQINEAVITKCDAEMRRVSKFALCVSSKCSNKLSMVWKGDSGGPLLYDGKIIGVGSYKISTNRLLSRAGYMPISPYIDWISHVIFS